MLEIGDIVVIVEHPNTKYVNQKATVAEVYEGARYPYTVSVGTTGRRINVTRDEVMPWGGGEEQEVTEAPTGDELKKGDRVKVLIHGVYQYGWVGHIEGTTVAVEYRHMRGVQFPVYRHHVERVTEGEGE